MAHRSIWRLETPLVLASKSLARRQILESCGLPCEARSADINEREIETSYLGQGGRLEELPRELARAKAIAVSKSDANALCLGADQILTVDNVVLHKAENMSDARERLAHLSGRSHRLTSAFAIARHGRVLAEGEDYADLVMRQLSPEAIETYLELAGPEVLSSVGVYQLEALGAHLFESITGSYTTILGLPLLAVLAALRAENAICL